MDKSIYWGYNNYQEITFDIGKRERTFRERGLAFEDAAIVFQGRTLDMVDGRFDYAETRVITMGHLASRLLVVVWTPRCGRRHIISMRKVNEREQTRFAERFGQE